MSRLSKEQELVAVAKAKEGCKRSKRVLLEKYEPLVNKLARKYLFLAGTSHTLDDLCQEGRIGILSAVETFDTTKDCIFFTWVYFCVRGAITKVVRKYQKHPQYLDSIEDSERAYNVPDPTQDPVIEDDLLLRLMEEVLDPWEFRLMSYRYGLNNDLEKKTLKECAEHFGLKLSAVSKVVRELTEKVKVTYTEAVSN